MIDWISADLPLIHSPIPAGRTIRLDSDGSVVFDYCESVKVQGSYDSSIHVRSYGSDGNGKATILRIDGNPSKFLQGHNVFGCEDLIGLMTSLYTSIATRLNLKWDYEQLRIIKTGEYDIRRIDINRMFEVGSLDRARAWLRAAELQSSTRHGRCTRKGGTAYWGMNSRRWALKAYIKSEELAAGKSHSLPTMFNDILLDNENFKTRTELLSKSEFTETETKKTSQPKIYDASLPESKRGDHIKSIAASTELPTKKKANYKTSKSGSTQKTLAEAIIEFASSKIRLELVMRSMEIKKLGLTKAKTWTKEKINEIYEKYVGRLNMTHNVQMTSEKMMNLPRSLQSSYMLWSQGTALKDILPKPTFYRHRKGLLKYGIDINFMCEDAQPRENKIYLAEVITAKPVEAPSWANVHKLIFNYQDPDTVKTNAA